MFYIINNYLFPLSYLHCRWRPVKRNDEQQVRYLEPNLTLNPNPHRDLTRFKHCLLSDTQSTCSQKFMKIRL